jgi:hypothetical protein
MRSGETLTNFTMVKGDLFLVDRGYASKKGISHCMGQGADFIVRLRFDAFAMFLENGERVDLPKLLAAAKANEAVEFPVFVDLSDD